MAIHYPRLPFVFLPYTRLELPCWGKLFQWFGVADGEQPTRWRQAPTTQILGKWHHYQMKLDLSDWCDRHTYFLGRYYELTTQLVLQALLQRGDRFVDVGANHGMISLLGAYLVGEEGLVESIEPNATCLGRIREHIQLNNIQHIRVHPCALGQEQATLELSVLTEHTGYGTLTNIPDKDKHLITEVIQVPVCTGDSLLGHGSQPPSLIKIDVEGYEFEALAGLEKTLAQHHCPVITEVVDGYLKRAGNTREQLMGFMENLGYAGYQMTTRRRWFRHRLHLLPMPENANVPMKSTDVLWLHQSQMPSLFYETGRLHQCL